MLHLDLRTHCVVGSATKDLQHREHSGPWTVPRGSTALYVELFLAESNAFAILALEKSASYRALFAIMVYISFVRIWFVCM